ncbi:MAG: chorismate-binding protein [Eudoraea sp.]|nr:chorismate-binding protein [Eudoraea sp.]
MSSLLTKAEKQLQEKLPFVLYRKPSEELVYGIFQKDTSQVTVKDFSESGFVFTPFNGPNRSILLRPDEFISAVYKKEKDSNQRPSLKLPINQKERNNFIAIVSKGIDVLKKGILRKVVLSRKIEVPCTKKPSTIFRDLLERYSSAFCYYWYHPTSGLWVGATPELLMNFSGNEFRTISLAATQKVVPGKEPIWGKKEKEEQEMVTQYIKEVLNDKVESLRVSETRNSKAGQLWHLRSDVRAHISSGQTKEIINTLHPTSAVCGMPLQEALDFILENEGYKRKFYTGYLGELNLHTASDIQLYVNLRCMELAEGKAFIYVGGGITAESDPVKEWQETVEKSHTMLNII